MLLLQSLLLTPVRSALGWDLPWFENPMHMYPFVLHSISLPVWLYFTVMDGWQGQNTFGKGLFRLRLRKQTGNPWVETKPGQSCLGTFAFGIGAIRRTFPAPMFLQSEAHLCPSWLVALGLPCMYIVSLCFTPQG